jgi:hypothetical protein
MADSSVKLADAYEDWPRMSVRHAAAWFREARGCAPLTLIGRMIGLVAIILIYPSELSVPR